MVRLPIRLALFLALLCTSCGPARYTVVRETNARTAIGAAYVYIGWLQLDLRRWKEYGYASQEEFTQTVQKMNGELQKEVRDGLPNRKLLFARSAEDQIPGDVELLVLFRDVAAADTGGGINGHNNTKVTTTVKFFEPKSQRELDSADIVASTRGVNGFAAYSPDACFEQTAHNVAVYVSEKLSGQTP